ncbi:hypothetical protein [Candidatus Nitrosocosmicus franklandus]|uniref:Uncharacterized protein n=1 Tax=Candidatus Nitrosocosmicus franklandianus TaxID=1798806 RepID=A0A484IAA3_9ARCH|nr:hypothetical protein [Candidatus Nitrosocosmicus franklandus]VFJ12607.1 protein of unknown function [Candidatus Nitrosocosmicus franklandus]
MKSSAGVVVDLIEFDISDELKPIVSEFGYDNNGSIKITFTEVYQNLSLHCFFDINKIQKSLAEFERKLKSKVQRLLPSHYNLIEEDFIKNLHKIDLVEDDTKSSDRQSDDTKTQDNKIVYQRKYQLGFILYEAVIVERLPKFVFYDSGTFNLIDKIEVANYTIYPADTIISSNPIPYSFESEQELADYLELAKNETFDSLFEKILSEFKDYVNVEEHNQIILSCGILFSYFQDKFGATPYNILVGENGSGKNSALLVFRLLGYRPLYITAASAANYYTFLGQIQEGQGTIIEDEADNICNSIEKKNMLKTGYSSGGSVPKVGFTKNGRRFQEFYLTFCHKWFAMEELPQGKNNRGVFDRSFIHYFMKGDVKYNIKDVLKDKDSKSYQNLIHLRKLLLAFKLVNYDRKFPSVKTNLKDRDAELTHPLLNIFYEGRNFEKIRLALSKIISEKTSTKSNSIEAMIAETLRQLIENKNELIISISNDAFYSRFKEVSEAKDYCFDESNSTFYLPDGTKISKSKIINLLKSKFKAKLFRTNQARGFTINKRDIEKISKQYDIIEEIIVNENQTKGTHSPDAIEEDEKQMASKKKVTEVTEVTEFKDAIPHFDEKTSKDDNQRRKEDDLTPKDKGGNKDTISSKKENEVDKNNESLAGPNTYYDKEDNSTNSSSDTSNPDNKSNTNSTDLNATLSNLRESNNSSITNNNTEHIGREAKEELGREPLVSNKSTINQPESISSKEPSHNSGSTSLSSLSSYNSNSQQETQSNKYKVISKTIYTPLKGVTGVTSVTALPPQYPCYFCGNDYKTGIDFDMELHLLEKHKQQMLRLPIKGNLDNRSEYLVQLTKKKIRDESTVNVEGDHYEL